MCFFVGCSKGFSKVSSQQHGQVPAEYVLAKLTQRLAGPDVICSLDWQIIEKSLHQLELSYPLNYE
jgi:hypothetical protein